MGGGGCTYDYSVSLSPNYWIMTFDLDLDLDLGLTILLNQALVLLVLHNMFEFQMGNFFIIL